jgi:2-keto-3-deoxy-L-rhamnonate aldolase RhmA
MNGQQLREALHAGTRVYGAAILSPSPRWPVAIKSLSVDFVFIDTEHIPLERETVAWMCQTYAALGVAPIVRVREPNATLAAAAIDGGAHGVVFPYVETVEQVRELVGAVKYRPLKGRRLEDMVLRNQPPSQECRAYLANHNANAVAVINIESQPAIDALPKLLAVNGLDAVMIGPHDLSVNLGKPENYGDPAFNDAARQIIEMARKYQVGAGVHFFWEEVDREIEWMRWGVNMLVHSTDLRSAIYAMKCDLDRIRAAVGDAQAGKAGNEVV